MTILDETILPGETKTLNLEIARLHTATKLKIPVIVSRAKLDGPTVLLSAGLHGDELNGVDIVRQIVHSEMNVPKRGTIICIPVINIFGFINKTREFPDGRDMNRVFPGSKTGSLAGRFAHYLVTYILPHVDYAIDFHAGGASRFNAPQIRIAPESQELEELAAIFHPPFLLYSAQISGSFRSACAKKGIKMLLFEGGKSLDINSTVSDMGVEGTKRFLHSFDMLRDKFTVETPTEEMTVITNSLWVRARQSGLLHDQVKIGAYVEKGQVLAEISDPYGKENVAIKAPNAGYVINVNDAPIVYQGDAVFHISKTIK
ncbi:succinylglutamate desuccinylase/aspartoacylase family protein [Myroides marinus]|uniref:succinylglutamate desuccinylase/aspartoacylase family protein n=1 Tax=Myroides marinus TaxID=703342 RepID=UPI002577E340|nr:M14 family metallopeptidase [Myroides marinus]MDM1368780.1 succinylglutamate desuccinylase/aspartoacylase family protein [Myroides marinus]MDM1371073.1 succinylglutamate desuccinylase/aspartoacylase family protein [Myroides marinus]MDM1374147.1 succinylglutamate desuccinylase/aspartoacylase family protein [Myroides marinus]MDM1382587.1 succinylglutamate desuccinylase/aspartoacylase family protein [Myroides marinus]MDM1388620.1 succinylglutamate desuccinylase/aspartoacylase family protein [M